MTVQAHPQQPAARDATVPGHDHAWSLVAVDFADCPPVSEYACSGCSAVWFV